MNRLSRVVSHRVPLALGAATWSQTGRWRDGATLFDHAFEVTSGNWFAAFNAGVALDKQGRNEEAIARYRTSLKIRPYFPDTWLILGNALARRGDRDAAAEAYRRVLSGPHAAEARSNLGVVLLRDGRGPRFSDRDLRRAPSQPPRSRTPSFAGTSRPGRPGSPWPLMPSAIAAARVRATVGEITGALEGVCPDRGRSLRRGLGSGGGIRRSAARRSSRAPSRIAASTSISDRSSRPPRRWCDRPWRMTPAETKFRR